MEIAYTDLGAKKQTLGEHLYPWKSPKHSLYVKYSPFDNIIDNKQTVAVK